MGMARAAWGVAATTGVAALTGTWFRRHASSDVVRGWTPPTSPQTRAGGLSVRVVGSGPAVMVLLHGLTGCGAAFGGRYDELAVDRRLVVPDLLGYGDSYLSDAPHGFGLTAQLDALDRLADDLSLTGPLTVVGHSMGATLALQWAAHRGSQVERVVAFSAPLYDNRAEGLERVRRLGPLEWLTVQDSRLAQLICGWMCRYRSLASWVAVAMSPKVPVPLARRGVLHTYPAYLATMDEVVLGTGWRTALNELEARGVPVQLVNGTDDPVPAPGRALALSGEHRNVTVLERRGVGHDLPLAQADWCATLLDAPLSPRLVQRVM
jgi:pimeloyl-ACP methyl ester carboxylesterase